MHNKNGDRQEVLNYRPVSITSKYKVLETNREENSEHLERLNF